MARRDDSANDGEHSLLPWILLGLVLAASIVSFFVLTPR